MKRNSILALVVITCMIVSLLAFMLNSCGETPASTTANSPADATKATDQTNATMATTEKQAKVWSEYISKLEGAAEENGIYALIITLSDKATEKGQIEYVFYGVKGTAHEGEIVCTYVVDYFKLDNGNYDITTYYDGELERHTTTKKEVKAGPTFSATVRAEYAVISYTPDGGEKIEIERVTADDLR